MPWSIHGQSRLFTLHTCAHFLFLPLPHRSPLLMVFGPWMNKCTSATACKTHKTCSCQFKILTNHRTCVHAQHPCSNKAPLSCHAVLHCEKPAQHAQHKRTQNPNCKHKKNATLEPRFWKVTVDSISFDHGLSFETCSSQWCRVVGWAFAQIP